MTPAQAHRIWQALQNRQKQARTLDSRIKDILAHMQASKLSCLCIRCMQIQRRHHAIEVSQAAS